MKKDMDDSLVTFFYPKSLISEEFKKLRAKLFFNNNNTAPRIILVTSALQNDGKSTIASNLAVSISMGISEHVLLIDCDMRSPSIERIFNSKTKRVRKGLSDYLLHGKDLSNFIIKTSVDKLSILPAGIKVDNPAELIASERMTNLLNEVTSRFNDRYIILDATPIIPTTEPTILSNMADSVILVVKSGKTPRSLVKKALNQIKKEKLMGIVFNSVKNSPFNKYYYYESK